jgi:hypothetical protein
MQPASLQSHFCGVKINAMKNVTLILAALFTASYYHTSAQYAINDWSVYFGNIDIEYVEEVATNPGGNVIITGKTQSKTGLATAGAHQTSFGGGGADAFIAKFNNESTLLWSSYFGGKKSEYAYALSADPYGNTYIGGQTSSDIGIATPGAWQQVYGDGNNDCFLAKFAPDGSLLWSTYFGGEAGDGILSLANNSAGDIFIGGFTGSTNGIATPGAWIPFIG